MIIVLLLATGLIASRLTLTTRGFAIRWELVDVPNARSSHQLATPRLGGVAIALTFLIGWTAGLLALRQAPVGQAWVVVAALAAGAVGLIDDLRSMRPPTKLLGQTLAVGLSFIVAVYLPGSDLRAPWMLLAAIWIVGFANVFNFMDGSDGLAAGCAAVFAVSLGALSTLHAPTNDAVICWTVAAVSLGFLTRNFAPASIFMGDGGSLFLGGLLGALAVQVVIRGVNPVAAVLTSGSFLFDAGWTVLQRIRRRELIWKAHKSHLYQRLLIAGKSQRVVACLYYVWSIVCGLIALAYDRSDGVARGVLLLLAVSTAAAVVLLVRNIEARGHECRTQKRRSSQHAPDVSTQ
jgi:UDP-N-acetylmuramyl pentapeptide phosphotransferase/UDP-N-acetylglucosamine-1-phosphate transferase